VVERDAPELGEIATKEKATDGDDQVNPCLGRHITTHWLPESLGAPGLGRATLVWPDFSREDWSST
jgi:hypothetical protein